MLVQCTGTSAPPDFRLTPSEIDGGISLSENIELNANSSLVNASGSNSVTKPVLLKSSALICRSLSLSIPQLQILYSQVGTTPTLTTLGSGDLVFQKILNLGNKLDPSIATDFGVFSQNGSGTVEFKDSLYVSSLRSTGGGKIWLNQAPGVPVSSVLSATNLIYLDNSSILHRDRTETVSGVSLELGPNGGGIEVEMVSILIGIPPSQARGIHQGR